MHKEVFFYHMGYKLRFRCGLWTSSWVFRLCQGNKTLPGWKTVNTMCYHAQPSLSRFFYAMVKGNNAQPQINSPGRQ